MAWRLLPTDYTDATWSGLRRYNEVTNDDGTVSFQDVTQYSNREKSFFGARDANRINEAINAIMSMVENGTDLYEAFQIYFDTQKKEFEKEADSQSDSFTEYTDELKESYKNNMALFEGQQQEVFTAWFNAMQDQLSKDAAGALQVELTDAKARIARMERMITKNEFSVPLAVDDDFVLTDDNGNIIMADWKFKEA